jgi:hypothetical protein
VRSPGVKAKKAGTRLKHGAAVQVMTYPRPKTKAILVEASRDTNVSLSSFMVLAALKEAAALQGRQITDLLPPDELQCYRACRVDQKRRTAAKRACTTIRAKRNETPARVDRRVDCPR